MAEPSFPSGPLELLIIQPTPFCNLDCDYCYLPFRQSKQVVAEEILIGIFRRVYESDLIDRGFTVVWHAGEPLVLPIKFYRRALEIIAQDKPPDVAVRHSFQTNGTLLNLEWCDFIREHGLSIGVSVDGPAFLHDQHRKTRSGRGTWNAVMKGIRLLRQQEIPFHVITVLTAESLDQADALFEFYCDEGINEVAFNIEEVEGSHTTSSLDGEGMDARVARFFGRFLERVGRELPHLSVREFAFATHSILRRRPPEERGPQMLTPFSILTVDCSGNFGTFSPELLGLHTESYPSFVFGNVLRDSLAGALTSETFRRVHREIQAGVNRCRDTCDYFELCGGGSPVNKLFENGTFDSTETMYCRYSIQAPINTVLENLESRIPATASPPVPIP